MNQKIVDPIIIIGAGIAGLTAARLLQGAGLPVLILDKGRGVGGRMATRRFAGGRFDHGAQFFTVRDERFQGMVAAWQAAGVVKTWSKGFVEVASEIILPGEYPRYRGVSGMTAVPKYLAGNLNVHLSTRITAVAGQDTGWTALSESGKEYRGRALLLTAPVPQSMALLAAGGVTLPDDLEEALKQVTYNPCLALMALFAGPSGVPKPGGLRFPPEATGPVTWMADNHQKGISPDGFAVTIHATPDYSRQHWASESSAIAEELLNAAREWLHPELLEWQIQRWRYSQPEITYPDPMICLPEPAPLAFAGDAYGGPRVEGAAVSGYLAAEALLAYLK